MEEKDLFEIYNKRLKAYQKKFNRDRVFPFTEIKIKEGGEKKISVNNFFDMYLYDLISIPTKLIEIQDKIIDFGAILSFLPAEFRFDYLSKLIFLLLFKNSANLQIKILWDEIYRYISDVMIKIVYSDLFLQIFLKDITIHDLLFEFTARIDPLYIENIFFAVFINWLKIRYSKKINIGTMRDSTAKCSNLRSYDDYIEKYSQFLERYSIPTSLLVRNYSKIGLDQFFVYIKISSNNKSQDILEKYFYGVPFFSHFSFVNGVCQFACLIPAVFKEPFIKYLKRLQVSKIIDNFSIDLTIESNLKLEFENSLKRDQNIFEIIPFTSNKFIRNKNLPKNIKKFPSLAMVIREQFYPKKTQKLDSSFDALDFFIFFNIEYIISENESIHNLLEKNSLISSVRDLNSTQMKKSYDLLFTDNLLPLNNITTINEFEKFLKDKYPKKKSIEKLILLFRLLKITDTSELTENFFEKWLLKLGNEFNKYFFNRSNHSMKELKSRFDILIEKGYLRNYIEISLFIKMNPSIINLTVVAKSSMELTKFLFQFFIWTCKNSIYHEFSLTTDTYLFFSKFLLQDDLISIGFPYLFGSSFISFDVISFFDFSKREWDKKKFDKCLRSLLKEISYEKKKKKTLKVNFKKWQDKLPVFQFADFFHDLRFFNKLNDISKNANLNRKKVIGFFKHYIQTQQFNFNLITEKFDFHLIQSRYPTLEKKKRIFIIISQSGTNINPFILKKTHLFSILFSEHLQNGWYYGGSMDNILILEYLIKKEDLKNKESDWNIGISAIKTRYPDLNIKLFELKEDLRFFGEQSLYSYSWYYDDFNYLKQSLNLEIDSLEVKNEFSFIFDSKFQCKEYHHNFLPWEFWQIIGYPVSVSVIIECQPEDLKTNKKIITRLPAGQIFILNSLEKRKKITLLAIVQLKNKIDRFFENLIPILNGLDCTYYISLIIPLTVYGDEFISK